MAVFERQGKKYVWLNYPKFVAELPAALADDEEFAYKVQTAYQNQVGRHHGWGFTVRHKGYRVRFDLQNTTKNMVPDVYKPSVEETPQTIQTLLKVEGV